MGWLFAYLLTYNYIYMEEYLSNQQKSVTEFIVNHLYFLRKKTFIF